MIGNQNHPCLLTHEKKIFHARIAQRDATFWLEKGYSSELIILEQSIGKYITEDLTVLCGYNISKLSDKALQYVAGDGNFMSWICYYR